MKYLRIDFHCVVHIFKHAQFLGHTQLNTISSVSKVKKKLGCHTKL